MTVIRKLETVSVIRIETTAGGVEYFLPDGTRLDMSVPPPAGTIRDIREPMPQGYASVLDEPNDVLSVLNKLQAADPSFAAGATRSLGLNGSGQ